MDYPSIVIDNDNSDDGDAGDKDSNVDNTNVVMIEPGEHDADNNGAISGTVRDDQGNPFINVKLFRQYTTRTSTLFEYGMRKDDRSRDPMPLGTHCCTLRVGEAFWMSFLFSSMRRLLAYGCTMSKEGLRYTLRFTLRNRGLIWLSSSFNKIPTCCLFQTCVGLCL